jgi:hypothetical protein
MKLTSQSFAHGQPIPARCAFGIHDATHHVALSDNKNPHLAWSDVPSAARSLALICHDSDVPSSGETVNKEGMRVPAELPRIDFFHWILLDLPARSGEIAEGEMAAGIVARGKDGPGGPRGTRQGINDYTSWFSGDAAMAGTYYGYDGPCPPWNDTITHHYHFTLYALDVDHLEVDGRLTGAAVRKAMARHVLDQASLIGTYTINPDAR